MKNLTEIQKRIDELDSALRNEHKPETSVNLCLLGIVKDLAGHFAGIDNVTEGPDETTDRKVEEMVVGGTGEFPKYLVAEIFNCFMENKKQHDNPGEAMVWTFTRYSTYSQTYIKEAIILGAFE